MDADEDEPLGRGIPAGSEQTITENTKPTDPNQASSHPTEDDDRNKSTTDGPAATATDLALEQDA